MSKDFEAWFNGHYELWDTEFKKQIKAAFVAGQTEVILRLPSEEESWEKLCLLMLSTWLTGKLKLRGRIASRKYYEWLQGRFTGDK